MGERRSSIKDFLSKLKSSKKPLEEVDELVENQNIATLLRRKILEEKLNISLSATGSSILDFVETEGKISYKSIGAIQIPVTVIGPLKIDGYYIRDEKYIPLASIYPALMEAVDLGAKIIGDTRIRVKINRCWLRLFTVSPRRSPIDLCRIVESEIQALNEYEKLKVLCFGRGAGHIINTVMIGENGICETLSKWIEKNDLNELLIKTIGSKIPVITPYLVFDTSINTDIHKGRFGDYNIEPNLFLEAYNALEDLKPIDNSLQPVILGVLTSFYSSIGIKPEYALRSDIRQYNVFTKFRKITVSINSRIILPLTININELSIMNKEVVGILKLESLKSKYLSEIASALVLVAYIGLIASIAKESV
ncbi:hypothetical protein Smar_1337 [Staphylothermus marinus F1]|uniref:Uncharacterized protein n=1 Tax=Staphylothermus marinus (strain ATCC 43588 / DSM 3639 / JCM 9404 / F1) TaxID=399550 RepID=A3DP68_STAMF|nr:hypothetical protein [Staphylothermus marinus]ABN70428.1 hypothetical protein Smar_1337 [Staphylothermus marinus F1]